MITLVQTKHPGEGINGMGGCHARWAHPDGLCPGVKSAKWLNELGEDEDAYGTSRLPDGTPRTTVGEVRRNWLRGYPHIERITDPPHTYDCPRCGGAGHVTVKE